MMIYGNTPEDIKKGIMKYFWRTLASFCKLLEILIEVVIYILAKIKDGINFVRDWLEEREYLN